MLTNSFFRAIGLKMVSLLILLGTAGAACGQEYATDRTLHVGIAGSAPFIIQQDTNTYGGIAFEIWQDIASEAGWQYKTQHFENVADALIALENNKLDVVVGPVSITAERAALVDFTQPYYQSDLAILSQATSLSLWERIAPFFNIHLLYAISVFLIILGVVGTLLWLAERKRSPDQFPYDPAHGIANGMWLAIVTMSTTGYGDKAPVTFWGRILAGTWMVISLIFATSMVAGIASTLTLTGMGHETIIKATQLSDKHVAGLPESPASELIEKYHAIPVTIENFKDGYEKLKNKEVDAVVFDRPQMLYYLSQHPDEYMSVAPASYSKLGFGFAARLHDPLIRQMNLIILSLMENGSIDEITQDWLKK